MPLEFPDLSTLSATLTIVKIESQLTVTGIVYLDMMELLLIPILEEDGLDDMLFQQDGGPPHFYKEVTDFLNRKFPEKWVGRGRPPRSPDLTPLHFLWGYVKDAVYVPPLATTLPELAGRIIDSVVTVTLDLLKNVWTEIEYRCDICRTTHGALIKHL
jgi:hypothetical protein